MMRTLFERRILGAIEDLHLMERCCRSEFESLAELIISVFMNGNKLLICGNGGSAADAQHLSAEFVSSFGVGLLRKSLPAIALTVDSSIISAISNDFGYEMIFSRQVEGLGKRGDALLAISTSGESKNCLSAVATAKRLGLYSLALTRSESTLYESADFALGVPSKNTQHIQECHIVAYHCLAEVVENYFLEERKK